VKLCLLTTLLRRKQFHQSGHDILRSLNKCSVQVVDELSPISCSREPWANSGLSRPRVWSLVSHAAPAECPSDLMHLTCKQTCSVARNSMLTWSLSLRTLRQDIRNRGAWLCSYPRTLGTWLTRIGKDAEAPQHQPQA
jgi:hypothetical protein